MMAQQKLLIVEDDEDLRELIIMAGRKRAFSMYAAENGLRAKALLEEGDIPDLIILDINMPGLDGFGFCRWLREAHPLIPVIFLSARSDEYDKILALEIGGDDYLTKPFSMKELFARTAVSLRRVRIYGNGESGEYADVLSRDGLELRPENWTCTFREVNVLLTVSEFRILRKLLTNPGHVFNRDQLARTAFPDDLYNTGRSIDIHISRIRSKLKKIDPSFSALETVYQVGYRWKK